MSIRVTLNCPLKTEKVEQLMPFLEANLPNVRGFAGNQRVTVLLNEDRTEMLLDEQWRSIDSHRAYLAFIEEKGVLQQLAAFLTAPPDIRYFEEASL